MECPCATPTPGLASDSLSSKESEIRARHVCVDLVVFLFFSFLGSVA